MAKPKQPPGPPTPEESEKRAQGCRAKAAYCKWVSEREPDNVLRTVYARLSVEWEIEATKRNKNNRPAQQ
jgi:hypothetical protein